MELLLSEVSHPWTLNCYHWLLLRHLPLAHYGDSNDFLYSNPVSLMYALCTCLLLELFTHRLLAHSGYLVNTRWMSEWQNKRIIRPAMWSSSIKLLPGRWASHVGTTLRCSCSNSNPDPCHCTWESNIRCSRRRSRILILACHCSCNCDHLGNEPKDERSLSHNTYTHTLTHTLPFK